MRDCQTGSTTCVDQVIREMTRRWNRLGCDHDAAFALTYLLPTEEYRRAVEDLDSFDDNAHVIRQDVVFADVNVILHAIAPATFAETSER